MNAGIIAITVGVLAFAAAQRPDTHTIHSKEVGRLDSRDAHAVFTALILEDSSAPSKRVGGVRIDFSWADKRGTMYIGQDLLQPQKEIFDRLTRDIERANFTYRGLGFIGSCEFRNNPGKYPLMADFNYSGPEAPALRIFAPTGEAIMFPGLTPRDLSKLLGSAIEELQGALSDPKR
jgi:hypothetical protein